MKLGLATLISIVAMGFFTSANAAQFFNPKYNGYAVDWCSNFENGCGKQAADLYCKKKGYPFALNFTKHAKMTVSTMTLNGNAICNPAFHVCDSFTQITCQETVKVFVAPKYNGYRLDWCKQFETGCGAMAAQAYCQKAGYTQQVGFSKASSPGAQTMTIGSNAICNPAFHVCDSFNFIQCKK